MFNEYMHVHVELSDETTFTERRVECVYLFNALPLLRLTGIMRNLAQVGIRVDDKRTRVHW